MSLNFSRVATNKKGKGKSINKKNSVKCVSDGMMVQSKQREGYPKRKLYK
jgi:hypothetical protein